MFFKLNNPKQKQINLGNKVETKERPRYSLIFDKKKRLMAELINRITEDIPEIVWVAQKYI